MTKGYLVSAETHARNDVQGKSTVADKGFRRHTGRALVVAVLPLLVGLALLFLPPRAMARSGAAAQVSIGISVRVGPPPLPIYEQPLCPGPGYIWTPGYWAWDPDTGYYWVPGTWVVAPFEGALWTPGYWGWDPAGAVFMWHAGYWGPRVGFYGGIDYGFGYTGIGYDGGYWRGGFFFYNRAVNRINVGIITHVYDRRVFVEHETRVSYNGGSGGIMARPTRDDMFAERDRRMGPVGNQMNQERMARGMPEMRWSQNHGRPDIAATARPEMFRGGDVSRATRSGGAYAPEQPRSFGRQPERQPSYGGQPERQPAYRGQPERQPSYRGQPERGNQPGPNRNERPMGQNQRQPQYRGQQGRPQQRQGERGGGNQNRQENRSNKGNKDQGGHPPHD